MESDEQLIRSFENLTLPLDAWNQRTHVRIAYIYLQRCAFPEAMERMRRGIVAFNRHNGIEESPTSGYNETTTVAMFRLVHSTMRAYEEVFPTGSSEDFCEVHPQLMNKHILRFFYSPARRMHPEAKGRFVEPDLASLPEVDG